MRFGLIDVIFLSACLLIGVLLGLPVSIHLPRSVRVLPLVIGGIGVYAALIYPFYRSLRLFPLILPRCPCCGNFQSGFHVLGDPWPRIRLRCPQCEGEFVIWMNGRPGQLETWQQPVLALKWPYALGRYKRMVQPEPRPAPSVPRFDSEGESSPPAIGKH
jgi:hypothetical protein